MKNSNLKTTCQECRALWIALAHEYLWDREESGGWSYCHKGVKYSVPEANLSRARRRVYREAVGYYDQLRKEVA